MLAVTDTAHNDQENKPNTITRSARSTCSKGPNVSNFFFSFLAILAV